MVRPIGNVALIFIALLFSQVANAEIIKVKGDRVLIRLEGNKVSVGERLDAVDSSGRKNGVVEVTSFDDTKAVAKIESGFADVGMKVARRRTVTVENLEGPNDNCDFRVNPIGLIGGSVDANFDFKIARDWTVGPQGIYLHAQLSPTGIFNSNYDVTAFGFGVRANWFTNGAFKDGFYFGPSLEYLSVSVKTADALGPATGTASGFMASALIGYGWFWNGFNTMLGVGYGSVLGPSSITIKDQAGNGETISANLSGLTYELSVGWAF